MSDVKTIVLTLYSVRRRFGRSKLTFLFTFKSHSLLTMNFSDTFYNKIFDARFATIQVLLKFVPKKFSYKNTRTLGAGQIFPLIFYFVFLN